ncbi:MAG TPA: DUF3761 domain-containing protein [Methylibium sp.]
MTIKQLMTSVACAAGLFASAGAFAAAPADAPAGTTGMCKDGSYSSAAEKKGACRGHKGVKEWYSDAAPAAAAAKTTKAAAPAAAATPAATTAPAAAAATTAPAAATAAAPATKTAAAKPAAGAAPGGGAGQVWANDTTKVYHCEGDKWYGKTKHGEYMSEADAKAKGFHADHGKACSK